MGVMQQSNNIFRILTIACIALFAVAILEQLYISHVEADSVSAGSELSSLQEQVTQAQSKNSSLQQQASDKFIEWRNAQGRLSLKGDGSGKVCYLTFDDGPDDALTPKNLAILTEKNAVATWFCLANDTTYDYLNLSLCKNIEAQGSAVGIHDWDQNESYKFYKGDVENYFTTDFDKTKEKLEGVVGHEIKIMRFAGGSLTIGYYNSQIGKSLPRAVLERGYQFFDWNVLAGDSEASQFVNGSTPKDKIVSNVLSEAQYYAKRNSPICVLMHDNPGKQTTTEALPEIIDGLRELGYEFKTLDYDTPGFYQTVIYS
jgi:peptidoglycan/xylan/chitin deacetylase (PgdA/CDA1 family)